MNAAVSIQVIRRLPGLSAANRVEPLHGGFSPDDLFLVVARERRHVLRLADPSLLERKQTEARLLRALRARGLWCPDVIEVGVAPEIARCFTIYAYLDGAAGREVIHGLSAREQADAGHAAGEQLRIIHDETPPLPEDGWQDRRRAKHERKVRALEKIGVRFEGQEPVHRFVEASWPLTSSSPFRLQHDDFQLGNILIDRNAYAGVIDFGNWDGGDPIEDFYKVPWLTAAWSSSFARAQVDGYLACGTPVDFWPRYNLFIALSLYSSLLWGVQHGSWLETFAAGSAEPLDSWRKGIAEIVETHDLTGGGPPRWYAR